ncbi:MAG: YraN family protein [Planctomycetota bacterium]|nr:MAG: YraN family protein [Planctomycetota bacterium]
MGIEALSSRVLSWWRHYRSLDRRGERAAERHLKRQGYHIVARRDRGRLGELDLVAVDGRTVVFVEVKTRRTHVAGHPAEAVDADKQRKLTRLALAYLKRHDLLEYSSRFDVVAVTWPKGVRRPTVEHYRGAFEAIGGGGMYS